MKTFSIKIDKCETLRSLANQIDDDMMTLLLTRDELNFVYKNNEIYLQLKYDIISRSGIGDTEFVILRIDKKDFLAVLCEGVITFLVDHDKVTIEFYGNKNEVNYSLSLPFQEDLLSKYVDYLELFHNCTDYPKINLVPAGDILRIARYIGLSVSSDNNYMSINNNKNLVIYKQIENPDFTANHKYLNLIRNVSGKAYAVKNYVVYRSENLCIAITRQVHVSQFSGSDNIAEFNKRTKPLLRVKFKCNNLSVITKKLKVNEGDLYLDLNEGRLEFLAGRNKVFATPIEVKKLKNYKELAEQKTAKLDFDAESFFSNFDDNNLGLTLAEEKKPTYPKIKIPSDVVRGVFNALNYDDYIDLAVKRDYYIIKIETLSIIFGRENKSDELL